MTGGPKTSKWPARGAAAPPPSVSPLPVPPLFRRAVPRNAPPFRRPWIYLWITMIKYFVIRDFRGTCSLFLSKCWRGTCLCVGMRKGYMGNKSRPCHILRFDVKQLHFGANRWFVAGFWKFCCISAIRWKFEKCWSKHRGRNLCHSLPSVKVLTTTVWMAYLAARRAHWSSDNENFETGLDAFKINEE